MNKDISVVDLKIDQKIEGVPFALKEFEKKVSRQGKPYYNVNLGDKTGEVRGKVWSEQIKDINEDAKVGDIVAITGKIQEYADKPQVIIYDLQVIENMAPDEFLPVTDRDRAVLIADIESEIQATQNPHLKALLELFWNNEDYRDRYVNFPAGMYVHHGYVGGLLEHVWEMNQLSKPFIQIYPMLNRDLLFTGIFFHDIGKLEELDIVGASIIMTTEGDLVAHIAQGLLFVDKLMSQIEDFPQELKNKMYHLILSHQGEPEFGSPVRPKMLEAFVLSMIDINGAYMNQAVKRIERDIDTGQDFTEYHRHLKRSFYQKDYIKDTDNSSVQKDLFTE